MALVPGLSRRAWLWLLAGASARAERGRIFASETRRYADRLTEFPFERLTAPEHSSWLPLPHCRAVSRRASFVIYAGDQAGTPQLFRLEHRDGASTQLTQAAELDTSSFCLLPGDRSALCWDGPDLQMLRPANPVREQALYRVRDGWRRRPGMWTPRDGSSLLFIEERDGVFELRRLTVVKGSAATVLSSPRPLLLALPRPGGADLLCQESQAGVPPRPTGFHESELFLASPDGKLRRKLPTAPGRIGSVYWRPDGDTVLYLSQADDGRVSIREIDPARDEDRQVAATSQFAHFAPNGDASVFVGVSGSVAQPHILLLLRVTRRELTLGEHRSADPLQTAAVFSPDSQRVYFQSEMHGKPAIYSAEVSRLVEQT